MDLGRIEGRHYLLANPEATQELKRQVAEHPDYAIAVLVGEGTESGEYFWTYATNIKVKTGEILDCNTEWWTSDYVCTDREEFGEAAEEKMWERLEKELGREPTEEELREHVLLVMEAHERYWTKAITIEAWN